MSGNMSGNRYAVLSPAARPVEVDLPITTRFEIPRWEAIDAAMGGDRLRTMTDDGLAILRLRTVGISGLIIPLDPAHQLPEDAQARDMTPAQFEARVEEVRGYEEQAFEQIHTAQGLTAGGLHYCRIQADILKMDRAMLGGVQAIPLPGVATFLPIYTNLDQHNLTIILDRQINLLEDAISAGDPIQYPAERPRPRADRTKQTMEDCILSLEESCQTLYREGTIEFSGYGESIHLNKQEREQVDTILERAIMTAQWAIDHGADSECPYVQEWVDHDNALAELPALTLMTMLRECEEVEGQLFGMLTLALDEEDPDPVRAPLDTQMFHFGERDLAGDHLQCSICKLDYELGDECSALPCRHRFHTECVTAWLDADYGNGRCPFHCDPPA